MANPKEKTPMCLVNELARYNKIQPEYKLLSETGPAHSKVIFHNIRSDILLYTLFPVVDGVSWLDLLSAVNSGGPALGRRGDQYKKSPALSSIMCSHPNHPAKTQSQNPPPPRQEPRWDLQGLRVYVLKRVFILFKVPTTIYIK